jgi:hypothetical protein
MINQWVSSGFPTDAIGAVNDRFDRIEAAECWFRLSREDFSFLRFPVLKERFTVNNVGAQARLRWRS